MVRRKTEVVRGRWTPFVKRPTSVSALCLLSAVLVASQVARAAAPRNREHRAQAAKPLTPDQRALQALNRLTFGPRPGEVANVERIGLDRWFETQLHPERIADDALATRLAAYPAMHLPQNQLVALFPPPGLLRRYSRGELPTPMDPVERAIYADGAYRYQERLEDRLARQSASQTPVSGATPGFPPRAVLEGVGSKGTIAPIVRAPGAPGGGGDGTLARIDTHALQTAVLNLPPAARVQRLAALSPEEMASFNAATRAADEAKLVAGMSPEQAEELRAMRSPERLISDEVLSTRLLRDLYSERQLQAVMTDFWLNHFSVYLRKSQEEPYLLPAYEREAVLPNALGTFEDLLVATAKSPAMLVYLDNAGSFGPNSVAANRGKGSQEAQPAAMSQPKPPSKGAAKGTNAKGTNENYARELMELHTLGVNGGYTQQDVIEVAKCFTGWTVERPGDGGGFRFDASRHEPGTKIVLGHTIQEGGVDEGLQVLHLLATSPATAHFVSRKLAERFVSDAPPTALVNRMSAVFLKSGGDIKAVLTTLFRSTEFWSPAVYRSKVKTPLEFAASAVRATGADVSQPMPLVQAMDRLGMPVYGMQTPNGYSWQAEDWVSSNALLTRMNFALVFSGNRLQGTHVDLRSLLGVAGDPLPNAATETRLETVLLGEPASEKTREAALHEATVPGVQRQAEAGFRATPASFRPTEPEPGVRTGTTEPTKPGAEIPLATLAGLLLGSPEFQRR